MTDPLANAKAAVALLGTGGGIVNWSADYVGQQIIAQGNGQFWVTDLGGGWGVSPDTSQVGQPFFIRAYSINGTLP